MEHLTNYFSESEIKQSIWWPLFKLSKPFESLHLQEHFFERVQLAADISLKNDTLLV